MQSGFFSTLSTLFKRLGLLFLLNYKIGKRNKKLLFNGLLTQFFNIISIIMSLFILYYKLSFALLQWVFPD